MGNNQDIQEIKTRADIVAYVSRYITLKKAGRNYTGLCPFHGEKTPSFHVNPTLGIYKCFGCGVHGDVIAFVQAIEHLEFAQAIEKIAGEVGVTLHTQDDPNARKVGKQREMYKIASDFYNYLLMQHPQGSNAKDYALNKRRLSLATIETYKVGYAPSQRDILQKYLNKKGYTLEEIKEAGFINERGNDKFTDRLMFTIVDTAGHVVGFSGRVMQKDDVRPKYLNSAESSLYKKRYLLFGLFQAKDALAKADLAIICEGQIDAIISQQVGVTNVVAPLGTGLTDTQLQLVSRYTKNVAFCFDNDAAGQKSLFRSVQLALALGLNPSVVTLPNDVKDIDDLVQKRVDDWKDRATHPIEFFALMGARLKELLKKDLHTFEVNFQQTLQTLIDAPELKQQLVAKQLSSILGLTEKSILSSIARTEPFTLSKEEKKQKQGILSTADYVMGVLVSFPLPLILMGKVDIAASMFPTEEQQLLYKALSVYALEHKQIIESVLDKKTKKLTVSWIPIFSRFLEELNLEYAAWLGKMSQENPMVTQILERIALDSTLSQVTINDDIMEDFFKAWHRLQKQSVNTRLEIVRKKIALAEAASNDDTMDVLQEEVQSLLLEMKKIEKFLN